MSWGRKIIREYYFNGVLKIESNIMWGKRDGVTRKYYENGKIQLEANFKNDEPDGTFKEYYENGIPMAEDTYKHGKLISQKNYDQNGKLTDVAKAFYDNGHIRIEASFRDGKPDGASREYFDNGKIMAEEIYKYGVLVNSKHFNKDGTMEGPIREYHENGVIRSETDQKAGIYKEYFNNGCIKIDASFKDNRPHGLIREFSDGGALLSEDSYENGSLVGSRRFDLFGRLKSSTGTLREQPAFNNGPDHEANIFKEMIAQLSHDPYREKLSAVTVKPADAPKKDIEKQTPKEVKNELLISEISQDLKPFAVSLNNKVGPEKGSDPKNKEQFVSGPVKVDSRSVGSKADGLVKEFYDTGELMAELYYKNGEIESETRYDKKGNFIYRSKRQDSMYR